MASDIASLDYEDMRNSVVHLLKIARQGVVRHINMLMTITYWEIGRRIIEFEQSGEKRAIYGDALIHQLAEDLTSQFGRGFSRQNLWQMRAFYLAWPSPNPNPNILPTLSGESPVFRQPVDLAVHAITFPLPWSAYVRLLSVKNEQARYFYETEALRCGWSVRQLDRQINTQFYERIALSRNKAAILKQSINDKSEALMTPEQAIKDPFVLEFLNLKDEYSESELEEGLIQHLTDFLLELGDDFAFVGRQRRLRLDDNWFRIDLLFFHRQLRCLIIADIKIGKFSYADVGQMHLYLNYAKEHWMKSGENPPIGLILCAEKGASEAHYALEGLSNKILAAEYKTALPDEHMLAEQLEKIRQDLEIRQIGRGKKDDMP